MTRARTSTERSRATRLRAAQRDGRDVAAKDARWLASYERAVTSHATAPRKRKRKRPWNVRDIARAVTRDVARVLSGADVTTRTPFLTSGIGDTTVRTKQKFATAYLPVSWTMAHIVDGEDMLADQGIEPDWRSLGRAGGDSSRVGRYLAAATEKRGQRWSFNLRLKLQYIKDGDTWESWISLTAMSNMDEAREAIGRRMADILKVQSDVKIKCVGIDTYVRRYIP